MSFVRKFAPQLVRRVAVTFLALLPAFMAAGAIRGVVRDAAGYPVAGATISTTPASSEVISGPDGTFELDVDARALRVTHQDYRTVDIDIPSAGSETSITLERAAVFTDNVVVAAIRAEEDAPIAKTDIPRDEIRERDHGQDVPMLLESTPSVTSYADSGAGGSGYSYFRLRGIDQTRINMTLDGVPLAESEDLGVYFTNFTDLLGSVETIQIQRGVGTSTVGSPSFGGSINFESRAHQQDSSLEVRLGGGSFGTRNIAAGWQSGFRSNGLAIQARVSANESNGYRDRSGIEQHTTLLSVLKAGVTDSWKLLAFTGREEQQLSFYAAEESALRLNPRHNDLSQEEIDRFGQDFIQLQYQRQTSAATNIAASAYTNRGHGYFRLWDDAVAKTELLDFGLDGRLTGLMVTSTTSRANWSVTSGAHANHFVRDHTLDGATRYYSNTGRKDELSGFAKLTRDSGRLHLYGDAQVRHADFEYSGDVDVAPVDWTFFNPKAGVRFEVAGGVSVFASLGRASREPTRSDMFSGEDNATTSHDLTAVKPEKVTDFEGGVMWSTTRASVTANLYAMEFRDEIAATGELSEVGLLLRRNVERSYRRGLELDAQWRPSSLVSMRLVSSLSRNRIRSWTQHYDVYGEAGEYVETVSVVHRDVKPLLTPELIVDFHGTVTPVAGVDLVLGIRHSGESQLDNTGSKMLVAPSFTRVDLNGSWKWSRSRFGSPTLRVHVENLFDEQNHYPGGYSYPFLVRGGDGEDTFSGTRYFYPLSDRAITAFVEWTLE